jgi:DegV family protein with EDD domain
MEKIKIITDSTADLPVEIIEEYEIEVIPLLVNWEGETYRDGVDISLEEFYDLLPKRQELPKTSQPYLGELVELYKKYVDQGYKIISIHLSSKLSGTVRAAQAARDIVSAEMITVVDSLFVSWGLGCQVLEAAWAIRKGKLVQDVLDRLAEIRERINFYTYLDTIDYVFKGGRINKVQALLGSLLNIKPLVEVKDGLVHSIGRVRSQRQGINFIINEMKKSLGGYKKIYLAVGHANAEQGANLLYEEIKKHFECISTIFYKTGIVIGTYSGPGAIGVTFYSAES